MIIRRTDAFLRDYRALPADIRERIDKQLRLLFEDFRHPALQLKKLKGTDRFEIRISKCYHLPLRIDQGVMELRRVGTHDIIHDEG